MTLKAEVTNTSYLVELTKAQWKNLETHDFLDVVCPRMRDLGVDENSIEYDGHFGRNIFFTITPEVSLDKVMSLIDVLVNHPSLTRNRVSTD